MSKSGSEALVPRMKVACITGYSQQDGVVALQGPLGLKYFSGELCVD